MQTTTTRFFLFAIALSLSQRALAQNTPPSFRDMERQMLEMQQRMMEQLRNSPFNDPNFAVPQWDTTFQFHFDTTFEGGSMSQFFRFSPFGGDSTLQQDFFGFGRMLDQFFNLDALPPGQPDYGIGDFPKDDGGKPQNDEDLLPEERLRQQEDAEKSGKKHVAPKSSEPKPDPRIKTIRI